MRCTKYMKPKHWIRHDLLIIISILAFISFIFTRLPGCDEDVEARRSSRLDNEEEEVNVMKDDQVDAEGISKLSENKHLVENPQIKHDKKIATISRYEEIDCFINDDYAITGRREGNETFIPFSFLQKYFEIDGKISKQDERERLEWHHSTARIYEQKPYKSDGVFMTFDHYHVEQRSSVKHISGVEGVPITVQWDPKGYFYAIQIAQFGLSHYTKNLTEERPIVVTYEDAEDVNALRKWRRSSTSDATNNIKIVYDEEMYSNVVKFQTSESLMTSKGFVLPLNSESEFVISFDAMFFRNFSICITVEAADIKREVKITYTNGKDTVHKKGHNIIYGLGPIKTWRRITRNLVIDYRKGITQSHKTSLKKSKATLSKVKSISVIGNGRMDNITMWTYNHMAHFMDAANWLLRNQDMKGGWPVDAERNLDDGMQTLPPGWYSAMAQGQAISTLTRAYKLTYDYSYLKAALAATKLYTIPSSQGGVLARFLDLFPWYEEYPTTPSSFVLNGFIFSLIGLYDLKTIASVEEGREATRLFEDGLNSLKQMLHLYDTGSGSTYDLRHVTLKKQPNLARWGYHSTHIAQLQLLASIDSDPIFQTTLDRWIGYTKGKKGKRQRNKGLTYSEHVVKSNSSTFDVRVLETHMSEP